MRLIDADELRDWLDAVELTEDGGVDINELDEYIRTAGAVDAVPIVQCKDCEHAYKGNWFKGLACSKMSDGIDVTTVTNDFYCKYGKAKQHIEYITRGALLNKLLAEFPADDKTASRIIEIIENMTEENAHNDT